jgi:tRNA(Arg) A34 adenosine deaminase TadA
MSTVEAHPYFTQDQHEQFMRWAIEVAARARQNGNHPFGAILVDPDGEVLLEAENTVTTEHDATGHAEINLMAVASNQHEPKFLQKCTMYTSTEPCVMCAGASYWAGIGHVVYGLSEKGLIELTGFHEENPTLDLPCRTVFSAGQREVHVIGPMLEKEAKTVHDGFWA